MKDGRTHDDGTSLGGDGRKSGRGWCRETSKRGSNRLHRCPRLSSSSRSERGRRTDLVSPDSGPVSVRDPLFLGSLGWRGRKTGSRSPEPGSTVLKCPSRRSSLVYVVPSVFSPSSIPPLSNVGSPRGSDGDLVEGETGLLSSDEVTGKEGDGPVPRSLPTGV